MQSPCILEVDDQFFLVTEIDDVSTLRIRISALLASSLIGLGFPDCGE
ncbi:exosporium protein G [Peribacillus simplex]|nr:exosporium protein G [Brevibacillus sp. JNUCC-41]QOS88865.1 exosporium protein G [Brevibacillus sp. JNUCC-41]